MKTFDYSAVDTRGREKRGEIEVTDQAEAIKRIKEMGFHPTRVEPRQELKPGERMRNHSRRLGLRASLAPDAPKIGFFQRIKPMQVAAFTRQLATLTSAGMPLLRGLRLLHEQETHAGLRAVVSHLALSIESGSTLSEALAQHPRVFNRLYVNLVKAGEIGGSLEISLERLAHFTESSEKIKRKVKGAMVYPVAVLTVAVGVMALVMVFVVPKFKEVFEGLGGGRALPGFTRFVLGVSDGIRSHFLLGASVFAAIYVFGKMFASTRTGREVFDRIKFGAPVVGSLLKKHAIARFTRTLGTLISSGVPILQALQIVNDGTSNILMSRVVGQVHENVKQGENISGPLRQSSIFPVIVAGMVDVGEQTGALPEMLNKVADNYEDEVDNSVAAMNSLIEPVMIVMLAIVVGSIVVAVFLPIFDIINGGVDSPGRI